MGWVICRSFLMFSHQKWSGCRGWKRRGLCMACWDRNPRWSVYAPGKICWPSYWDLDLVINLSLKEPSFSFRPWKLYLTWVTEALPERQPNWGFKLPASKRWNFIKPWLKLSIWPIFLSQLLLRASLYTNPPFQNVQNPAFLRYQKFYAFDLVLSKMNNGCPCISTHHLYSEWMVVLVC